MAIPRPSLSEIYQRTLADLDATDSPYSFKANLAKAIAGLSYMLHMQTEIELEKLLPDKATGPTLDRWANMWGTKRKDESFASGELLLSTVGPVTLKQGTPFTFADMSYIATTDSTCDGPQTLRVPIRSQLAGKTANRRVNEKLNLAVALENANSIATVREVDGGADRESDDSLRERLLFAMRNPAQGGSIVDYLLWISQIPGVFRCFARPAFYTPGTVDYSFLTKYGAQPTELVAAIEARLQEVVPIGAAVRFIPFEVQTLPLTLVVEPSELNQASRVAIRDYLLDNYTPRNWRSLKSFEEIGARSADGTIFISKLSEVVSLQPEEKNHSLRCDDPTLMPIEGKIVPQQGAEVFFV